MLMPMVWGLPILFICFVSVNASILKLVIMDSILCYLVLNVCLNYLGIVDMKIAEPNVLLGHPVFWNPSFPYNQHHSSKSSPSLDSRSIQNKNLVFNMIFLSLEICRMLI